MDDEPYARERLRELCALEPDVAVVGEASHGVEAIEQVEAARPNLLLLDVQMRGTNGFDVLERLKGEKPLVVFVSAYDQYALAAFGVEAVDYLLKPFDRERFRQAIRRVRSRLSGDKSTELADRISTAVRETVISVAGRTPQRTSAPKRIVAERDGRLFFIAQPDIDSVEANRNYVNISAGPESFTHPLDHAAGRGHARRRHVPAHASLGDREHAQDSRDGAPVPRRVRAHAGRTGRSSPQAARTAGTSRRT